MSSGPKIGNRHKGAGRPVKLVSTEELEKLAVSTNSGKDRLKAQNELVKRNGTNKSWSMPWGGRN